MSALRRSRSKTAPEHNADIANANDTMPAPTTATEADPAIADAAPPAVPAASVENMALEPDAVEIAAMLSSIPATKPPPSESALAEAAEEEEDADDHEDRSSSLSELGDASDLQSDHPTPRMTAPADLQDNDSEAETERLEPTPRKLARTGTAASITSEALYECTPSKLVQTTAIDEDQSVPASPTPATVGSAPAPSANAALDALSFLAAEEADSLELAGKKRKRSSVEQAAPDEHTEAPARKRSSTAHNSIPRADEDGNIEAADAMEVDEEAEPLDSGVAPEDDADLDEVPVEAAVEAVEELVTVAKLAKPRKGRRGKRRMEMTAQLMSAETADAEGEDNDEGDDSSLDEEAAKKKMAIDELAKIEKKFKIFQKKCFEEQIAQYERELEMLKQPNCTHPEYLAMVQCLDERRASKLEVERELVKHKLACNERQIIAQRHQLHSQYFQSIRQLREDALADCNRRIYDLQMGRRNFGVDGVEYAIRLPKKQSDRVRQQAAYNLEVSVLSGVAKYVGFPAAPEISSAKQSEIDSDFRAMKIVTRPPPQPNPPYIRPYASRTTTTADEAAAEEQFIEKTPWANPHHPAHQHSQYAVLGSRAAQTYQTPAGQRRMVDIHAPNGSASTIDALSNPPSSAAGPNHQSQSNGRMPAESLSPVLQLKRNPAEHIQYAETPGSIHRGFGRDVYAGPHGHVLSSPAGEPRHDEHRHAPRWAGLNGQGLSGHAPPPPLPPGVGRQMPAMGQMGRVGVANGGPLSGS